jgi:hypothetical protein
MRFGQRECAALTDTLLAPLADDSEYAGRRARDES